MTTTPIGLLLLSFLAIALVVRRDWLFPALIVATTLHAPAAIVVTLGGTTAYGITPWLACAAAGLLHFAGIAWRRPQALHDGLQAPRSLAYPWLGFFAVALASAFTLPFMFSGVGVFPLHSAAGFDAPLAPLAWSMSNLIQAVNAAVVLALAPYAATCAACPGFRRRCAIALGIAVSLAVATSLYQRAEYLGWVSEAAWVHDSLNPGYVHQIGWGIHLRGIGIPRMAWPFSEPSYASVWFAATYAGGLLLLLFSRRPLLGAACTLASGVALLNSLGMSGVGAAVVVSLAAAAAFAWRLARGPRSPDARNGTRVFAVVMMGVALAGAWQSRGHVEYLRDLTLERVYDLMVAPRLTAADTSGQTRSLSNRHAAKLVWQTGGLGVGLGSNRASSYLTSAASNLGVAGVALLVLGVVRMLRELQARAARGDALACFVLGACAASFIGVALGIPDLNWPAWWVWPLLGFALLTRPATPPIAADTDR